ncbi:transglycosylase SLT domain-containing protein [Simiduia curdlanivorans]|uniref:Transglycosylase SLT domain-containing protein n=1 Tax=Simiduia curdlanivorans TaxID=1492769 RepID=A0ABV8V872_9GAMM
MVLLAQATSNACHWAIRHFSSASRFRLEPVLSLITLSALLASAQLSATEQPLLTSSSKSDQAAPANLIEQQNLPVSSTAPMLGIFATDNVKFITQRAAYLEAQKLLPNTSSRQFIELKASLKGYPLEPYIDYRILSRKLSKLPYREVDEFLDANPNSYLGNRLLRDWLLTLERKQHWHDYQSYYRADLGDTDLACYHLKARLLTGDETAYTEVTNLWNVGRSQPKACDSLFKLWQNAGQQTAQLTWSRATQAIEAKNRSLTRYLAKYAPAEIKSKLDLLVEVDRYPEHMDQVRRFAEQSPEMQFIILHGIQRLARKDAGKALKLWERYDAQHLFADQKRIETQELLIAHLSRQGLTDKVTELAQSMSNYSNIDMISGLARDALANVEWELADKWIRRLPAEELNSSRWRYWSTRIAEIQGHSLPPYPDIASSYKALAKERSFYGFLAADRLGLPFELEDEPSKVTLNDQHFVANSASILRAKELFELGQINFARQEWRFASRQFSPQQLQAAGALAANWGWYRGGIQAMIDAQSWDDLTVRFPLAFESVVKAEAKNQAMDANLLFAIARQESAFSPDAKSPVGALGLMQLMPATAKQTAKKAGITYRKHDLLSPETNVALGSRYLNEMLGRFNGNPAFAAAAYNAGPHRVTQWLSQGRDQLPLDVWIETIPFKETRGYVQNVMVFSVIYAYRNGSDIESLKDTWYVPNPAQKQSQSTSLPAGQGSTVTNGAAAY